MRVLNVTSKKELLKHRLSIEALFFESFGKRPIGQVWDWAYMDNPNGEPIVSMCYDDCRLVGHYAIVPLPLSNRNVRKRTYISMTTMVAESHRKYGLFTQLAKENYRIAVEVGVDFVFGFPNTQSAPGFRNRLGWSLPDSDYVATVDKATLLTAAKSGSYDKSGILGLDMQDPIIRAWRLSRPGATYTFEHGLAIKHHQGAVDLLWWDKIESLAALPEGVLINVLAPANSGLATYRQFDYQFGGIGLCSGFDEAAVNREMAISDLF